VIFNHLKVHESEPFLFAQNLHKTGCRKVLKNFVLIKVGKLIGYTFMHNIGVCLKTKNLIREGYGINRGCSTVFVRQPLLLV
jgi:hypothetical protein